MAQSNSIYVVFDWYNEISIEGFRLRRVSCICWRLVWNVIGTNKSSSESPMRDLCVNSFSNLKRWWVFRVSLHLSEALLIFRLIKMHFFLSPPFKRCHRVQHLWLCLIITTKNEFRSVIKVSGLWDISTSHLRLLYRLCSSGSVFFSSCILQLEIFDGWLLNK